MDPFLVGVIVLFSATALFFVVLFSFIFYWHLTKVSYFVVPLVFAFEFFVTGFLMVCVISIALNYLPALIKISGI